MRRRFNSTQRNYMIAGLCVILLIMTVAYSAFSSQLNISGTSSIDSNFLVKITNIEVSNIVGSATDKTDVTTYTDTTATIGTNLVLPGDSITYDITVANQGTIDAVLSTITKTDTNNSAILFEVSGLTEGETLKVGETAIMKVVVGYNAGVTSQPDNLESTLKVELNYEQATGLEVPSAQSVSIGGNSVLLASSGDGLYADETRAGRYVYRGANPDNYIMFNDELWRIVAKEADGTYKIVRNDMLSETMAFDTQGYRDSGSNRAGGTYCANSSYGCNAWAATTNLVGSPAEFTNTTQTGTVLLDASLNTYLNGDYYNNLSTTSKGLIVSHNWGVGAVYTGASWTDDDEDTSEFVAEESAYIWNGKVALLAQSDAYLANSNQALCGTANGVWDNLDTCKVTNYLIPSSNWYWLLSPNYRNSDYVFGVYTVGGVLLLDADISIGVRPAIFLSSVISLSGSGEQSDPFTIS